MGNNNNNASRINEFFKGEEKSGFFDENLFRPIDQQNSMVNKREFIADEVSCPVCGKKIDSGGNFAVVNRYFFFGLIGRHVDDCLQKEKSEQYRKNISEQYRTGVENSQGGRFDGLKVGNKSGPVKVEGPRKKRPGNSEKPTISEFFNRPSGGQKRLKLNKDRVRKSENLRSFLDARK